NRALFELSSYARGVDALDAIGALFHYAARTHGDVRIFHQLLSWAQPVIVFEKIKAADFVGAIVRAVACADATIVHLQVQAFGVVNCRTDGTNQFAGRVLTMH